MIKMGHPLFTLLILSMVIVSFGGKVKNIYTWKFPEFEWLSKEQKEDAIRSGIYNPSNCMFEDANEAEGKLMIYYLKKVIMILQETNLLFVNKLQS